MGKGGLGFLFCFFVYSELYSFVRSTDKGNESIVSGGNDLWSSKGLQDLSTLCPYSSFCLSQPLNVTPSNDVVSCCQKCSCDTNCYEIGNCCPDSPFASAGKLKYKCVNLSNVSKDSDDYLDDSLWYHLINDCKDPINDLNYPRCNVPSELQDLIPVSDPNNGRVYKNSHCAMCNGVQNYISWTLKSASPEIVQLSFRTVEELNSYVFQNREKFQVYPTPPDEQTGEMSRCFAEYHVITKCNITGDWDIYEKDIEDACLLNRQGYNGIFTVDSPDSLKRVMRYANVYCYLCNKPRHIKKKDLCNTANIFGSKKSSFESFSALLDFQINENSDKFRCKSGEMWDHFTRRCRRLTCPGGSIPVNGICKSFMSHSEGYKIRLNFKVKRYMQNVTVPNRILFVFLKRETLPLLGAGCGSSGTFLGSDRNLSNFYFTLGVLSTQHCSPERILTNTRKLAMKNEINFRFKYKDTKIHIGLTLLFGNNFQITEILEIQSTNLQTITMREIDSSILFYCPGIRVSDHEAEILGITRSVNTTTDSDTVNNEGSLSSDLVCIDVYFGAREAVTDSLFSHLSSIYSQNILFQVLFVFIVMKIIEMHDCHNSF